MLDNQHPCNSLYQGVDSTDMPTNKTVAEKVGDWFTAYTAIQTEMTPQALRVMMQQLTSAVPPDGVNDLDQVNAYIQRVNAAASIARLVFANDRAAGIAAAMITQSGVSRPVIDTGDDT